MVQSKGDCNDSEVKVNLLVNELCDGWDNNCNKFIDEGYVDMDSDGKKDCVDLDDDGDVMFDVKDCQFFNVVIFLCIGKECGMDGCGVSCGMCVVNGCFQVNVSCMVLECCQIIVIVEKLVDSQWKCTGCGDVDFVGQCWGDYMVVWCIDGVLIGFNCVL